MTTARYIDHEHPFDANYLNLCTRCGENEAAHTSKKADAREHRREAFRHPFDANYLNLCTRCGENEAAHK